MSSERKRRLNSRFSSEDFAADNDDVFKCSAQSVSTNTMHVCNRTSLDVCNDNVSVWLCRNKSAIPASEDQEQWTV